MLRDEYLWTQKYRPHKIADVILPEDIKKTFQSFVDNKNIPNLVLSGGPGMGKTTVAMAMLDEIGSDYIKINGSMDRNIDTLRNEIKQFASSVSFAGGRKYVILDEADYLNPQSTQPALRSFMEDFSKNCGFILTCNYKNKLIEPLRDSRCTVIDFAFSKKDKPKLMTQFFKRIVNILETEKVTFDKAVLIEVITRGYPDFRGLINKIQTYSETGNIDAGILTSLADENLKALVDLLRERDYSNIRKWVAENIDGMENHIFRRLYDTSKNFLSIEGQACLVLILAETQYRMAFSADHEITMMACMIRIMSECEFL